MVRADNEKSMKMLRQAGAVREGVARNSFEGDIDGIAFGMLREEAERWIK